MNEELYNNCKKIGFNPKKVAEVGVYFPETSNIIGFINDGIPAMLIEPDPICVRRIETYFQKYKQVEIFPVAIYEEHTEITLYRANASTFVSKLESTPALVNDKYKPQEKDLFYVQALTFDEIDDGLIELLSVDTEGCEWYVIKNMLSRPHIISLETHAKKYKNPFMNEIELWIKNNSYKVWYKNDSDTVYINTDKLEVPQKEKILKKIWNILTKTHS